VGLSTDAAMHTPVEVTERVWKKLSAAAPDCLVSLGGGSTTGLGKALALRTGLPQIAVPTTYAGSEATPILGQTEQGRKTTLHSPKVLPRVILYDVDLTLGMPVPLSAVSGMNAMAHAVEALYAKDGNPVTSMLAEQGIAALAGALPIIAADSQNLVARSDALFGAWACGNCLGTVGMALHHKLCHTLGGSFDLPTRKHTPSFFRTRLRSTRARHPTRWRAPPGRSTWTGREPVSSTWPNRSALRRP
jgi:alcohol dehydrogenase class IV